MSRVKNPQEKKRLAYELDHRNASGESVKAWRRNKPLKKAKANRSFRKATNDLVQATLREDIATQSAIKKAGSIIKENIIDWAPSGLSPMSVLASRSAKLPLEQKGGDAQRHKVQSDKTSQRSSLMRQPKFSIGLKVSEFSTLSTARTRLTNRSTRTIMLRIIAG
jgi:hypothetical protein